MQCLEISQSQLRRLRSFLSFVQDLKKILDNATQGFVYMSLGSNIQSNELTSETRGKFITAFSKLPYTVLWKFEDEHLPNKPDNVVIMKWVPQLDVLGTFLSSPSPHTG